MKNHDTKSVCIEKTVSASCHGEFLFASRAPDKTRKLDII